MERITLTVPEVQPQIQTLDYRPITIVLDREPRARILVVFLGTNGERREWRVEDPVRALTLIKALNKADLTTNSLDKRCMTQALADGVFAGTITGTPDA
jgi:hypothetical protein